jgi:hypothetical protein
LALLVLGRHVLNLWERASLMRLGEDDGDRSESVLVTAPDADPALLGR